MNVNGSTSGQRRWPIFLLGVTILTSAGIAAAVSRYAASDDRIVHDDTVSSEALEALLVRIEGMEQRLKRTEAAVAVNPDLRGSDPGESVDDSVSVASSSADILERVARLEAIERDRREAQRERAEQRRRIVEARRAEQARIAGAAATIMIDPAASDEAKARAWGNVRMNAVDAWTDEIVTEAVRIGTMSQNAGIRADIWRQAHANRTHPLLLQPLLQALAADPDAMVREEAAETLDLYLDEPGVREALQIASQYDAAPNVQRQATVSLAGPRGGF